jgi:hypothetical protein
LGDLVEALARRGPLVVGLDDLQWADPSSLLTLGALARRRTAGPVALVAARRCQGLAADDPEVLRAAVDAYGRSGRPLELALAAEDAAAAFARRGRPEAAVPLLRRALEGHEQLGAARGSAGRA